MAYLLVKLSNAIDYLLIHETAANNFEAKITDILRNNGDMII